MAAPRLTMLPHRSYGDTSIERINGIAPTDEQVFSADELNEILGALSGLADLVDAAELRWYEGYTLANTWVPDDDGQRVSYYAHADATGLQIAMVAPGTNPAVWVESVESAAGDIVAMLDRIGATEQELTVHADTLADLPVLDDAATTDATKYWSAPRIIAYLGAQLSTQQGQIDLLAALTDADDTDYDTAQERLTELKRLAGLIGGLGIAQIDGLQDAITATDTAVNLALLPQAPAPQVIAGNAPAVDAIDLSGQPEARVGAHRVLRYDDYDVTVSTADGSAWTEADRVMSIAAEEAARTQAVEAVDAKVDEAYYADLEHSGFVDVTKYGVVATPSGVDHTDIADEANWPDNSTALIALRDLLISIDRKKLWTLYFPKGVFQYTNNRWIMGLRNVRIRTDNGAALQCDYNLFSTTDSGWFSRQDTIFNTAGDIKGSGAGGGTSVISGHLIDTVELASTSVTLKDLANASFYSVGALILLHSDNLQVGGYSPNVQRYEWFTITAISGAVLTLDNETKYLYRDDHVDILYDNTLAQGQTENTLFGKARIIRLSDRPAFVGNYDYHEYVEIDGFNLLHSPKLTAASSAGGGNLTFAGRRVVYKNIKILDAKDKLYPRESEICVIEKCEVAGTLEIDKIIGQIHIKDSAGHDKNLSLSGGTGCRSAIVQNYRARGKCSITADHLTIIGGSFSSVRDANVKNKAPIVFGFGSGSTVDVSVFGPELLKNSLQSDLSPSFSGGGPQELYQYFTVGEIGSGGSSILIDRINPGAINESVPGTVSRLKNGWELIDTTTGDVAAVVGDIIENGIKFEILLKTGTVSVSQDLKYFPIQSCTHNGKLLWGRSTAGVRTSSAVPDLGLTISDPPTQAELQSVSDKVDALLAALRTAGTVSS